MQSAKFPDSLTQDGPDVYTSNPFCIWKSPFVPWYPWIELDEQDRLVENKQTESEWRGAICEEVADRIIYGIKHLLPPAPGATSLPISPNTFVWKTSLKLFEAEQIKYCRVQFDGFQLTQIGLDVMEAVEFCLVGRPLDPPGPPASDRAFRRSEIIGIMGCL